MERKVRYTKKGLNAPSALQGGDHLSSKACEASRLLAELGQKTLPITGDSRETGSPRPIPGGFVFSFLRWMDRASPEELKAYQEQHDYWA